MKLLPSPAAGIDWAEEARRRYSGQANITYPSRVAAQQVRDFILELAAAYERAVIMLEATQSALQSTRPEALRSTVAPDMVEFATAIINVDKMARDGNGGHPATSSELLMAQYLLKLSTRSPLGKQP